MFGIKPKFTIGRRYESSGGSREWKIKDWQRREKEAQNIINAQNGVVDLNKAKEIHRWILKNIVYVSDEENYGKLEYWPTSDEVLKSKKEDCDGIAIACWRKLRDAGFPDDKIGIACVDGHAFCVIFRNNNDFWVLDNGSITYKMELASEALTREGRRPRCAFTLWNIYAYEIIEKK